MAEKRNLCSIASYAIRFLLFLFCHYLFNYFLFFAEMCDGTETEAILTQYLVHTHGRRKENYVCYFSRARVFKTNFQCHWNIFHLTRLSFLAHIYHEAPRRLTHKRRQCGKHIIPREWVGHTIAPQLCWKSGKNTSFANEPKFLFNIFLNFCFPFCPILKILVATPPAALRVEKKVFVIYDIRYGVTEH